MLLTSLSPTLPIPIRFPTPIPPNPHPSPQPSQSLSPTLPIPIRFPVPFNLASPSPYLGEELLQIFFSCFIRQITHKQLLPVHTNAIL